MKLTSLASTHSVFQMLGTGGFLFQLNNFFGYRIHEGLSNLMGQKYGSIANMAFYIILFFWGQSYLHKLQVVNLNNIVNSRDPQGDFMIKIIMQQFPGKVNPVKYKEQLMERSEHLMMTLGELQYQQNPYKLHNPEQYN